MRKVLVADDDKAVRDGFCRFAARRGMSPVPAASGAEALSLAAQNTFHAAILDGHLGDGVTGFEVCSVLKRGRSAKASVFIVSGVYVGLLNRALALHHGAAGYFEKPVPLSRLGAALDASLAAPCAAAAKPVFAPASVLVLVVDADEARRRRCVDRLLQQGYTIISVARAEEALKVVAERVPDCVLLDRGLAELCGPLRGRPELRDLPIIAVNAGAAEGAACLSLGADHFVEVGADPAVLLETLAALMRRRRLDLGIVAFGDLSLRPDSRAVNVVGERKATLAAKPFKFMCLLVERAGVPVSREELCEVLDCDAGALEKTMSRLREELGELAVRVQTSRGLGWTYVPQA